MSSSGFKSVVVADAATSLHTIAVTVIAVGSLRSQPTRLAMLKDGWVEGPLVLQQARLGAAGKGTDRSARASYLDSTVSDTILGGSQGSWRTHRLSNDIIGCASIFGAEVVGLHALGKIGASIDEATRRERLSRPPVSPPRYAVLLHASIDPEGKSLCDVIEAVRAVGHRVLSTAIGGGFVPSSVHHGEPELVRLVFASATNGPMIEQLRTGLEDDAASAALQWGYTFAAGVLPAHLAEGRVPDFELDAAVLRSDVPTDCFIPPSGDWRITVLRSGVACIGIRPDPRPRSIASASASKSGTDFYDSAEVYLHTIYADAILLGMLQRHALLVLRNVVLAASRERDSVSRARAIELEMSRFREQFWWTQVSRGGIGDRLLHAYHVQHSMPEMYEIVEKDAASVVQRARFHSERGRAAILALIGLVGLLTACFSVARAVDPEIAGAGLLVPVGVFVVITGALFLMFPDLSRLANDAAQRSRLARGRQ